jgi:hypothetical protein
MSYTLLALTMDYKIGDKVVTNVVTTSFNSTELKSIQSALNQEAVNLKTELKKKLVVLTGMYHNMLYGSTGLSITGKLEQTPSNYYKELSDIEETLLSKYDTMANYFKPKDISRISKSDGFKIIRIKD